MSVDPLWIILSNWVLISEKRHCWWVPYSSIVVEKKQISLKLDNLLSRTTQEKTIILSELSLKAPKNQHHTLSTVKLNRIFSSDVPSLRKLLSNSMFVTPAFFISRQENTGEITISQTWHRDTDLWVWRQWSCQENRKLMVYCCNFKHLLKKYPIIASVKDINKHFVICLA